MRYEGNPFDNIGKMHNARLAELLEANVEGPEQVRAWTIAWMRQNGVEASESELDWGLKRASRLRPIQRVNERIREVRDEARVILRSVPVRENRFDDFDAQLRKLETQFARRYDWSDEWKMLVYTSVLRWSFQFWADLRDDDDDGDSPDAQWVGPGSTPSGALDWHGLVGADAEGALQGVTQPGFGMYVGGMVAGHIAYPGMAGAAFLLFEIVAVGWAIQASSEEYDRQRRYQEGQGERRGSTGSGGGDSGPAVG